MNFITAILLSLWLSAWTLARKIEANEMHVIPKPISTDDLEKLLIEYGLGG